jgi:hypothetical protein
MHASQDEEPSTSGSDEIDYPQHLRPKQKLVMPTPIPPGKLNPALFENGALLIDKPLEWTSFDVCQKLKNSIKFLGKNALGRTLKVRKGEGDGKGGEEGKKEGSGAAQGGWREKGN